MIKHAGRMRAAKEAKPGDIVTISSQSASNPRRSETIEMTQGKREMSTKESEADRARNQAAATALAGQYRAIGPAAIVAALLCAPKKTAFGRPATKAA